MRAKLGCGPLDKLAVVKVRDRRALRRAAQRLAEETGRWIAITSIGPGAHPIPMRGPVEMGWGFRAWWARPSPSAVWRRAVESQPVRVLENATIELDGMPLSCVRIAISGMP